MNIKEEISKLELLIKNYQSQRWGTPEHKVAMEKLEALIKELDANADGLVGKHISFQVADGYARYIIVKELKASVKVFHLDIDDGYRFLGVYDDKLPKGLAKQRVDGISKMKSIFAMA